MSKLPTWSNNQYDRDRWIDRAKKWLSMNQSQRAYALKQHNIKRQRLGYPPIEYEGDKVPNVLSTPRPNPVLDLLNKKTSTSTTTSTTTKSPLQEDLDFLKDILDWFWEDVQNDPNLMRSSVGNSADSSNKKQKLNQGEKRPIEDVTDPPAKKTPDSSNA